MDTEKLYDQDAFLREFDAVVTECYEGKDGSCLVTLDRTAFYPEGGGQPADHGVLGGAARARGLIAITGMELLVQQAILAFNHFTSAGLEQEATRRELLALVNET